MTARDEAIQVLYDTLGNAICKKDGAECHACRREATEQLDLVMPFVVRLAIERGALVETDKKVVVGRDYQNGRYHNYFAPLYRVVES